MNYGKPIDRRAGGGSDDAEDPLGANSEIGRKLRRYYDDLIKEEVPDRFAALLSELERSERARRGGNED